MTLIPLPFYIYYIIIVFYIAETISLQYKNESTLNALFYVFFHSFIQLSDESVKLVLSQLIFVVMRRNFAYKEYQ